MTFSQIPSFADVLTYDFDLLTSSKFSENPDVDQLSSPSNYEFASRSERLIVEKVGDTFDGPFLKCSSK